MLPAYFSPSYLGGFPASLGVYQQLQHLSHPHLDASGVTPLSLPLLPHSFPPQLLLTMATPNADVHGPLSPSKQPFPPQSSNALTPELVMSCPVTSAQMSSGPMTSGTDASEAMVSYLGKGPGKMQEARNLRDDRIGNGAEGEKGDQEDRGTQEEKDVPEHREQEARTGVEDGWSDADHTDVQVNEEKAQEDRSASSTSAACTSTCCQPPELRWKPSPCAVKFSIDSILGLSTARTSRQENLERPTNSAGSSWTGDPARPSSLCSCVPTSSSSHSSHANYLPKASPSSLHSSSVPATTAPTPTNAPSASTHSPQPPHRLAHSTCTTSPPPRQSPPPQGHSLATGREEKEAEGGRSGVYGEEGAGDREEGGEEEKLGEEQTNFPWLQCTRYHPPKLQRSKKKDGGGKKRKLGRNPRVPFTQHQVAVLEEKFRRTHYLSSMDVAELSSALSLSETRVKIWFQNRRARERREREASQRAQLLTHKPYQPLSIPSVTWALTSQLSPSPFTQRYRNDLQFRTGLFPSSLSAFTPPLPSDVSLGPSSSLACPWPDGHNNSDDENMY